MFKAIVSILAILLGLAVCGYGVLLFIVIPRVCDTECAGPLALSAMSIAEAAIAAGGILGLRSARR